MSYDTSSPSPNPTYGNPPLPPPPPPRQNFGLAANALQSCLVAGCVTIFVPVLLIGGFFLLLFALLATNVDESGAGPFGTLVQSSAGGANIRERVLKAGAGAENSIALVNVHGAIGGSGSSLDGTDTLSYVCDQLRAARDNDNVKAVILQVDSPGGGLSASDEIHHQIRLVRASGKPVLAWAGGMMTSGGYYIAAAAEEIMASPTATLGSIGVIIQHFQVQDLLQKIGVKVNPITSTDHKDIGSPFREMTPEERKLLQDYIDQAHQRFVYIVAKGRNIPEERVRELADGTIFGPDAAMDKKLIDGIGYIEDAVAWAEEKTGNKNMRVIGYKRVISLGDLFNEAGRGVASAAIEAARSPESSPKAMAIWEGGR